jgi:LemA protein
MVTTIIIIAVVALVVFLIMWVISVQNKLVKADEISKNALKQINVQQMSRYDAIKALVKLAREYAGYEGETLQKVIAERKITSSPNPTVADINNNERALSGLTAQVTAVAEQYPQLKANEGYLNTMKDIKAYEENVRLSRMTFNDTVTKFNNQVRMFPGSLVASMLGFAPKEYLADDVSKADYPDF